MGIKVNSVISFNSGALAKLDSASLLSLKLVAEVTLTEVRTAQVMPFSYGILQNTKTFVDDKAIQSGKVAIVSEGPYARRLYYHPEYNFNKGKNRNAQGKWLEPWTDGKFITKAYSQILKRQGNL